MGEETLIRGGGASTENCGGEAGTAAVHGTPGALCFAFENNGMEHKSRSTEGPGASLQSHMVAQPRGEKKETGVRSQPSKQVPRLQMGLGQEAPIPVNAEAIPR